MANNETNIGLAESYRRNKDYETAVFVANRSIMELRPGDHIDRIRLERIIADAGISALNRSWKPSRIEHWQMIINAAFSTTHKSNYVKELLASNPPMATQDHLAVEMLRDQAKLAHARSMLTTHRELYSNEALGYFDIAITQASGHPVLPLVNIEKQLSMLWFAGTCDQTALLDATSDFAKYEQNWDSERGVTIMHRVIASAEFYSQRRVNAYKSDWMATYQLSKQRVNQEKLRLAQFHLRSIAIPLIIGLSDTNS